MEQLSQPTVQLHPAHHVRQLRKLELARMEHYQDRSQTLLALSLAQALRGARSLVATLELDI